MPTIAGCAGAAAAEANQIRSRIGLAKGRSVVDAK
jgi:hypothetical protein